MQTNYILMPQDWVFSHGCEIKKGKHELFLL